jgi:hypothetical protein
LYDVDGEFPNVGQPTFSFNYFVNTPFATDRHGFGYQLVNEMGGYTGRYPGGTPGGSSALRSTNDSLAVYTQNAIRMRFHENGRIKIGMPISTDSGYFVTVEPPYNQPYCQWLNSARSTGDNAVNMGITPKQLMQVGLPHGQAATNSTSGAQCVVAVAKSDFNNRSINCAGTVNSSGADYAEYMVKKDASFTLQKGDICGITSNGTLTNVFSESLSFVIKSTNPSFVGNEQDLGPANTDLKNLSISDDEIKDYIEENSLVNPYVVTQADKDAFVRTSEILTDEQVDTELENRRIRRFESDIKKRMLDERVLYNTASDERFKTQYEPKRFLVERIAFCGQVPVNLVGTPGDYVVPTQGPNDSIVGIAKRNVSFEEYQNAVGKIIKVLSSTQVLCIVKML